MSKENPWGSEKLVSSDYLSLLRYLSFWQKCSDNTLAGTYITANTDKGFTNCKYEGYT